MPRESVLCKYKGALVLMEAAPGVTGNCPQCGNREFQLSTWSGKEWTECTNSDCDFEVLTAHVKEVEAITTKVSKGDCKP